MKFTKIPKTHWKQFAEDVYNIKNPKVEVGVDSDGDLRAEINGTSILDANGVSEFEFDAQLEVNVKLTCTALIGLQPVVARIFLPDIAEPAIYVADDSGLKKYYEFLNEHHVNPVKEWLDFYGSSE